METSGGTPTITGACAAVSPFRKIRRDSLVRFVMICDIGETSQLTLYHSPDTQPAPGSGTPSCGSTPALRQSEDGRPAYPACRPCNGKAASRYIPGIAACAPT